jgi:hypothetical protein
MISKYGLTVQQLSRRALIGTREYPLLPHDETKKKNGRIIDTGHNFVVHFADGSAPIPCRKLKDALLYVNLVSVDEMPESYRTSLK